MASEVENSHVGLVELEELEVIEIDEELLRELLEEEEQEEVDAEAKCLVESVKNDNRMMDKKEEDDQQQKKISCSDQQQEGCNNIEFEWMNNYMMEMELPASQNDQVILNYWYPDDMVGMMVDFGYANAESWPQICLWEDL